MKTETKPKPQSKRPGAEALPIAKWAGPDDDLVPVKFAARKVGKRVAFVKEKIAAGRLLAYRNGGSDEHPRMLVSLSSLKNVIRTDALVLPGGATGSAGEELDELQANPNPELEQMLAAKRQRKARSAARSPESPDNA